MINKINNGAGFDYVDTSGFYDGSGEAEGWCFADGEGSSEGSFDGNCSGNKTLNEYPFNDDSGINTGAGTFFGKGRTRGFGRG